MSVIDAHVHLYPPEANAAPATWALARGEAHWEVLCNRRRKDGRAVQAFPSLAELLRDMDVAGVERAVLLGWYWENHATCVEQNRFYETCVTAYPERLAAFATLHPAAGKAALDEVRRARDAGFVGLGELSPHSQRVARDDATWRAVLALAGELKLPVNLHVTDPSSKPFPGRVDTPLDDFTTLAREFPQTQFILAHWGGGLAFGDSEPANVWYDTAASPLLYGAEVWRKARSRRVLFGSDFPLVLYPKKAAAPDFTGILEEARAGGADARLLAQNARELFRW